MLNVQRSIYYLNLIFIIIKKVNSTKFASPPFLFNITLQSNFQLKIIGSMSTSI